MCTCKFGENIPKYVTEENSFYEYNGNTLWWDDIYRKIKNVLPTFETWRGDTSVLTPGYQKTIFHMLFDVNMGENLGGNLYV